MKNTDPESESGGLAPLVRQTMPEVAGVGLNSRLNSTQLHGNQISDHAAHLLRSYGLPPSTLHHPFHVGPISHHPYSSNFLGNNVNPAALLASLSRPDGNMFRGGRSATDYSILPPNVSLHAVTSLHAILATGEASRQSELMSLLKDSPRPHEILLALTKLTASSSSTSPLSLSSSSTASTSPVSSLSLTASNGSPLKLTKDTSPLERFTRASSLSPSSYMTPRSLNGSPSEVTGTSSNYGSIIHSSSSLSTLESLSPTSPSTEGEGSSASITSRTTPTRKLQNTRIDRLFTCKICNRSFGYKHVLQNHERTHTGEKPFECKECHKRFTRDHHLKTHMRLHTGEKPYHCTHCDRQFVQVANLRRHLRVHTGEKPYTCETCSAKFSDSNQLKAHVLIHKGEKPFGCNKCSGKFRRRHHLIHHKCPNEGEEHHLRNSIGATTLPPRNNFDYVDSLYRGDGTDEEILGQIQRSNSSLLLESTADEEPLRFGKKRVRKCKEPRRVISDTSPNLRSPPSTDPLIIPSMPLTPQPEQTEPEDLSINGSHRENYQKHMYRANIALTTSTNRYSKSPFKYPNPIAEYSEMNDNKRMEDVSQEI